MDVTDDGEELLEVRRADEVPVIADRRTEDGVHHLVVRDEATEGPKDLLVGMGVSVSGAVLQGVLRNPLVDPYLLGAAAGAGLGGSGWEKSRSLMAWVRARNFR